MSGENMANDIIFDADLFIDKSYQVKSFTCGDVKLKIFALHSAATTDYDLTGQVIWPASKLLAEFLTENVEMFQSQTILELGAGAGLAGLVAAKLTKSPRQVTLTDNNDHVLQLLQKNIDENFTSESEKPSCTSLSWERDNTDDFTREHGNEFDLIIGADVVFWPNAVPLLFETVHFFLSNRPSAQFILCYTERSRNSTELLYTHARLNNLTWKTCYLKSDADPSIKVSDKVTNILLFTLNDKDEKHC